MCDYKFVMLEYLSLLKLLKKKKTYTSLNHHDQICSLYSLKFMDVFLITCTYKSLLSTMVVFSSYYHYVNLNVLLGLRYLVCLIIDDRC